MRIVSAASPVTSKERHLLCRYPEIVAQGKIQSIVGHHDFLSVFPDPVQVVDSGQDIDFLGEYVETEDSRLADFLA